ENDLVVAHDVAAPDGGDADVVGVTALADGVTVVDRVGLVGETLSGGLIEHEGSAAGGVHLAIVVALHDLHVVVLPQKGGAAFDQLHEDVHAQGHVGRAEDGHLFGGRVDGGKLLLG